MEMFLERKKIPEQRTVSRGKSLYREENLWKGFEDPSDPLCYKVSRQPVPAALQRSNPHYPRARVKCSIRGEGMESRMHRTSPFHTKFLQNQWIEEKERCCPSAYEVLSARKAGAANDTFGYLSQNTKAPYWGFLYILSPL